MLLYFFAEFIVYILLNLLVEHNLKSPPYQIIL
jgi:hypothetical protein